MKTRAGFLSIIAGASLAVLGACAQPPAPLPYALWSRVNQRYERAAADLESEADTTTTFRPVSDFTENNPQGFNLFPVHLGIGSTDTPPVLLNLGWNPHLFPTPDRTAATLATNFFEGSDHFAFPDGFDSITALTPWPTRTVGTIRQTRHPDGSLTIQVRAFITWGALSIYRDADVFGDHLQNGEDPGCSPKGGGEGTGCNDLADTCRVEGDCVPYQLDPSSSCKGPSCEPDALIGQDADGFMDYYLAVDMDYTAKSVENACGGVEDCIDPTIPYVLSADYQIPGVTVTDYVAEGYGAGHVTTNKELAGAYGLTPGADVELHFSLDNHSLVLDVVQ